MTTKKGGRQMVGIDVLFIEGLDAESRASMMDWARDRAIGKRLRNGGLVVELSNFLSSQQAQDAIDYARSLGGISRQEVDGSEGKAKVA